MTTQLTSICQGCGDGVLPAGWRQTEAGDPYPPGLELYYDREDPRRALALQDMDRDDLVTTGAWVTVVLVGVEASGGILAEWGDERGA